MKRYLALLLIVSHGACFYAGARASQYLERRYQQMRSHQRMREDLDKARDLMDHIDVIEARLHRDRQRIADTEWLIKSRGPKVAWR